MRLHLFWQISGDDVIRDVTDYVIPRQPFSRSSMQSTKVAVKIEPAPDVIRSRFAGLEKRVEQ